jgi:CheY-like chemotaxis protein
LTDPVKILGVDDEADFEALIRQRFRRQVRDGQYTFRFAHHGEEALDVLAAEPDIQLMLLDINMPVMDGLTLLTELRERKSPVRTIMVSAYGDMTNLRTAMNRGAFDFVTKPVDFADLEVTIHKTLADIAKLREIERLHAAAERARSNLSRYFSPNIVDLLAAQDEPLGAVRRQTVAVLFVDIVGFTRMAEAMPPEAVVTMLREFHQRMTAQIFACGGTVEKYAGPPGAGHFVKLVHNGIEFGMMQAIGEGFDLLTHYHEPLDIDGVLDCWRHGSVIRSWLIDLLAEAYKADPRLEQPSSYVEDTGEVNWLVGDALCMEVPIPVIAQSVMQLFASRDARKNWARAIVLMRHGFGGHPLGPDENIARERHEGRVGDFYCADTAGEPRR